MIDIEKIRQDFPILASKIHGKPLAYFDNGATSQRPQQAIDAVSHFYQHDNANIHRGVHTLSDRATHAYESARHKAQQFINASSAREIIFTRGTTESINLVATAMSQSYLQAGDEVIVSMLEHHSNIVPWQMAGVKLRVIPVNDQGELQLDDYKNLFNSKTKLVALTHVSNAIGTINPVKDMIALAHQHDVPVLLDGAQAAPHLIVDVQDLDCEFYTLSAHKMVGPTGVGVLYGKEAWLDKLPPYQGGGSMIKTVSFEQTTYADLPQKFEAGTPNIAGAVGTGAAIDYLQAIGLDKINAYEHDLLTYAEQQLSAVPGLRLIGQAKEKSAILSFVLNDVHPHDIGTILDHQGIAVRAGHHCAMPLMDYYGLPATVRASLCFYNTKQEVDVLVKGLQTVNEVMGV